MKKNDVCSAQGLTKNEIVSQQVGFTKSAELRVLFTSVDTDKNGTLDFSEFLCLLYLWNSVGTYEQFFNNPVNSHCIHQVNYYLSNNSIFLSIAPFILHVTLIIKLRSQLQKAGLFYMTFVSYFIRQAFSVMAECMHAYDQDGSRYVLSLRAFGIF